VQKLLKLARERLFCGEWLKTVKNSAWKWKISGRKLQVFWVNIQEKVIGNLAYLEIYFTKKPWWHYSAYVQSAHVQSARVQSATMWSRMSTPCRSCLYEVRQMRVIRRRDLSFGADIDDSPSVLSSRPTLHSLRWSTHGDGLVGLVPSTIFSWNNNPPVNLRTCWICLRELFVRFFEGASQVDWYIRAYI